MKWIESARWSWRAIPADQFSLRAKIWHFEDHGGSPEPYHWQVKIGGERGDDRLLGSGFAMSFRFAALAAKRVLIANGASL